MADPPSSSSSLSLTRLSAIRECAEALRVSLRRGLFERGPRVEMHIYRSLCSLLHSLEEDSQEGGAQASFVAQHHMQDILAACVYLLDEQYVSNRGFALSEELPERPDDDLNPSEAYVSAGQRAYCAHIFFALCWRPPVPVHTIVQALHPLLDPTAAATVDGTVTWNGLGTNALGGYAAKRAFVAAALNGLIIQSESGVRAVLRALLLTDAVPSPHVAEAAGHVVRLLTARDVGQAWVAREPGSTGPLAAHVRGRASRLLVVREFIPVDDCARLLGAQHVHLFEEQAVPPAAAHRPDTPEAGPRAPSFLAKVQASSARLVPEQTLEERLHLYLSLWLNHHVRLPDRERDEAAFAAAYRRLYATNRYVLSPAFGLLSLHSGRRTPSGAGEDLSAAQAHEAVLMQRVLTALRRVRALAHGCTLGAAPLALTMVAEVVMPGLLSLTAAVAEVPPAPVSAGSLLSKLSEALGEVWARLLECDAATDALGRALIMCAVTSNKGRIRGEFAWAANRVEGPRLVYESLPAVHDRPLGAMAAGLHSIWRGLHHLLRLAPVDGLARAGGWVPPMLPARVQHAVLAAAVDEAGPLLLVDAASEGGELGLHGGIRADPHQPRDAAALRLVVEGALLSWPAEALVGEAAALDSVLLFIARVARLSRVCLRWALGLLPRLLDVDALQASLGPSIAGEGHAEEELEPARVSRALASVENMLEDVAESVRADGEAADDDLPVLLAAACAAASRARAFICERSPLPTNELAPSRANTLASSLSSLATGVAAALDAQSAVMLSLSIARLAAVVDEAAPALPASALTGDLYAAVGLTVRTLLRCLTESGDVCGAGHAVRALMCIGMYRLDAPDTSVLAAALVEGLLQPNVPEPVRESPLNARAGVAVLSQTRAEQQRQRQARLKVRLLDVLLSWCDYDTDGRTLRNVDDYCRTYPGRGPGSLFRVLCSLCRGEEEAAVEVAALHLVGHYVVAVHPRVSLAQVGLLCRDVFRHTRLAMSKAACASMLGRVVAFLSEGAGEGASGTSVEDADVEEATLLAGAMASFQLGGASAGAGSLRDAGAEDDANAVHAEVVRQHGRELLHLLRKAFPLLANAPREA